MRRKGPTAAPILSILSIQFILSIVTIENDVTRQSMRRRNSAAAAGGDIEVVKCLLSQGVDVLFKNDRGHSALTLATVRILCRVVVVESRCATRPLQSLCMSMPLALDLPGP